MNVQLVQLMHMIRSFIVPIVVKIYNCKLEITEELNRPFSTPFYPPTKTKGRFFTRAETLKNFLKVKKKRGGFLATSEYHRIVYFFL